MPQQESTYTEDPMFLLNELNSRTRILENKYTLMGERILIINQNMIEEYRGTSKDLLELKQDVQRIKKDIQDIKDTIRRIVQEMSGFAKKENVKVIEKYINILNPLNFVTHNEVLDLIKKRGDKTGGK